MKKLIQEDTLLEPELMMPFSEYRKGSATYGPLIATIMDWLRIHKTTEKGTKIVANLDRFLKETNIELKFLMQFIENKNKTNLISFDINIENNKIIFSNLNKSRDYNKESKEL